MRNTNFFLTATYPASSNVPQVGMFTEVATNKTTPFFGVAVAKSYQTRLQHQLQLIPFIGHSFKKGFVYLGVGPTWSRTQTNINSLIGFAELNGMPTDVSGAPQDFSGSGWVFGCAGTVGGTCFLNHSWFLNIAVQMTKFQLVALGKPGMTR